MQLMQVLCAHRRLCSHRILHFSAQFIRIRTKLSRPRSYPCFGDIFHILNFILCNIWEHFFYFTMFKISCVLQVGEHTLQADWINSTHISLKQLHSKCLYVDRLPPNYRDMAAYRKMFSVLKNPPYCQVKRIWLLYWVFIVSTRTLMPDKVTYLPPCCQFNKAQ